MKFKAVCTDIDGTLLNKERQLSSGTIAAFRNLPAHVPVILASSRMPSAMTHLQRELGVEHHPLVCYNGGYVIHYNGESTPHVFETVAIPLDVCEGITALAHGTDIHVSLYTNDLWFAPRYDEWTEREARITKVDPVAIKGLDEVFEEWKVNNWGGHKVMCMGPEAQIEQMEQDLKSHYAADIHIYRSRPTYIEIAPKQISKASGLQIILEKVYGLSLADAIAFGDNYNDIELLEQAGWGVAVSNARPEVKAVANELTADSKEDGVAKILQKYFS